MQTAAYKLRSSGKQIATDKAGRADVLKISFTIMIVIWYKILLSLK